MTSRVGRRADESDDRGNVGQHASAVPEEEHARQDVHVKIVTHRAHPERQTHPEERISTRGLNGAATARLPNECIARNRVPTFPAPSREISPAFQIPRKAGHLQG